MVSQFVSPDKVNLLGDLSFDFPEGTHAVGRLDNDSEGLLILTTNKKVQRLLFLSKVPHKRNYIVLVKDKVSEETLQKLRAGVSIKIKGGAYYTTLPCEAELIEQPKFLTPGIFTYEKGIPHSWLSLSLTEGKFHQIRKMMGVVKHPVRRLIRVSIENIDIVDLASGEVREMEEKVFFQKLKIIKY